MMVIWTLLATTAMAKDCSALEGKEKGACMRDEARADLEKQLKGLGKCKADTLAAEAKCLQDRADLTQQIADLYAAAVAPKAKAAPRKAKAERSNTNRMEADVNEE